MVKDVNPQFFKLSHTQGAANTYSDEEVELVVIPNISGSKVMVMEVLKALYFVSQFQCETDDGLLTLTIQVTRDNQSALVADDSDDLLIPKFEINSDPRNIADGTPTNVRSISEITNVNPKVVDLTDGNGNGIILPHRNVYIGVDSSNLLAANTGTVWLLYRFKEIPLTEFLGDVIQ